jgi:predicted nucleotidyltransferase
MRRATITVPEQLDRALEEFIATQPARPSLTSVVEAALEAYLVGAPAATTSRLVTVARHRPQLVEIARSHGATRLGLFGSVADATDGPDSDVDFWVETASGVSLFDLAAMSAEFEELLGSPVDVVTLGGLDAAAREGLVAKSFVL